MRFSEGGRFVTRGFVWHNGVLQAFASLGGQFASAYAVNDAGVAVGQSDIVVDDLRVSRAVMYRNGRSMDLNGLLSPDDASRWQLREATDINEAGVIVGTGSFNRASRAFVMTPVPEPGTWALMTGGLGVVVRIGKRRKR